MKSLTRRRFLEQGAMYGTTVAIVPNLINCSLPKYTKPSSNLELHVFSKHLQFLNYQDAAECAAEIGFDGIELAVRPKGHVLPENVNEDLPQAVKAIKSNGLKADMMVTSVNNAESEIHRKVLKSGASLGIKKYRLGYLKWKEDLSVVESIKALNLEMIDLAKLNSSLGIQGNYQNHSGKGVGAAIWDIWHLLEGTQNKDLGCQYDIRHGFVEGGKSWPTGLDLIHSRINSIVLKDFVWGKVKGKWKIVNVPIGEGMVDFAAYFKMLKAYEINVPVSVHFEYPLGGAEHGDRNLDKSVKTMVVEAMKRDVVKIRELWDNA